MEIRFQGNKYIGMYHDKHIVSYKNPVAPSNDIKITKKRWKYQLYTRMWIWIGSKDGGTRGPHRSRPEVVKQFLHSSQ